MSTRLGSGGKNPSYRGSFNLNRVLVKDTLAVYGALLMDRTQYRQQPTYKNDDRQSSSRIGATLSQPLSRNFSVQIGASTGTSDRTGTDFDTVGAGVSYRWGGGL